MSTESKSILIVDRHKKRLNELSMLCQLYADLKYNVYCVETAERALLLLSVKKIHLAIVDSEIADQTGVWLCQQIYNQNPDILVLPFHSQENPERLSTDLFSFVQGSLARTGKMAQFFEIIDTILEYRQKVNKGEYRSQPWEGRVVDINTLMERLQSAPQKEDIGAEREASEASARLEEILYEQLPSEDKTR